jgi:DNA-binding PadR family transcriptional regulator
MASVTRLVVLGAVRQFQPVHGYFLRRELLTWHVDEWANIQPGSIYNALRALEQDGYVEETAVEADGRRPARTTYSITHEGEVELLRMLRATLWDVEPFDTVSAQVIASFMFILTREEVLAGLTHRIGKIDAITTANEYNVVDSLRSMTTPDYVREIFDLSTARLRGEQEWARTLIERIRGGAYAFADDAG